MVGWKRMYLFIYFLIRRQRWSNEALKPRTKWICLPEVCLRYRSTLIWALEFKSEQVSKAVWVLLPPWANPLFNKSRRRFLRLACCTRLKSFLSELSQVEVTGMYLRMIRMWVWSRAYKSLERAPRYWSKTPEPPKTPQMSEAMLPLLLCNWSCLSILMVTFISVPRKQAGPEYFFVVLMLFILKASYRLCM